MPWRLRMLEKKEYAAQRAEMIEKQLRRRGIRDAGVLAAMTAALHLQPGDRVLEIGTGCGYHAAVLSRLAREVFTIERRPELASFASTKLAQLGFPNAHVHCGDGTLGLPELAPF